MTRAKLAEDCMMPRIRPCSASLAAFEARLVRAGEAIEFPIANAPTPISNAINPPEDVLTYGTAISVTTRIAHPIIASLASPIRAANGPKTPPCTTAASSPTNPSR